MTVIEYLIDNFVFIYELIGLFIIIGIGVHISERTKKLTTAVIILIVVETAVFRIERWTHTFETLSLLRPMLTAANYSIYPVILVLLMQITVSKGFSRKRLLILLIPEFVCVPLFFTSQWTHLIFYFHENNSYSGGIPGLQYLPYLLFGFYAVVIAVRNFRYFSKSSPASLAVMAYIIFVPLTGVLLYKLEETDRDYNAMFTSSIVLYYIYVYTQLSKTDSLTSLLNRQSYYKETASNSRAITGVVSVDMNDLKYLNDSFGHEAGDKALQTVSEVLRSFCGQGGRVYRVGGDEFMILYTGADEADIAAYVSVMREKMEETEYMCAFGYAMRKPGENIADAIRLSDGMMYEDKARMKAGRAYK